MARILFVDDDANLLDGVKRMLRPLRDKWEVTCVSSGAEALDRLAAQPADLIVTDLRMPGMDGTQLLEQVRAQYPETARIVLSGHADRLQTLKSLECAHQFLSKPCSGEVLRDTIERTLALADSLSDPALRRAVSGIRCLPSVPAVYQELRAALRSAETSAEALAKIIAKDMSLAAKLLQLANSASFGSRRSFHGLEDAVLYLGVDIIASLAFSLSVFSAFDSSKAHGLNLGRLWNHSLMTARLAGRIMKSEGASKKASDDAFLAGLLHDIGKLLLATACTAEYQAVLKLVDGPEIPDSDAERQVFGTSHAEVGAYLLRLWALPDDIIQAVAFHHAPIGYAAPGVVPMAVVHVADVLEHEKFVESCHAERTFEMDRDYLAKANLIGRIPEWEEIARELLDGTPTE